MRGGASENSPYISTTDPKASNTPKDYGENSIEIDTKTLQNDIDSGKVKDVEIVTPRQVQEELQSKIDKAQTRYDNNPTPKNKEKLKEANKDLTNATRDGECLVKGCVPKEYIK